MPDIIRAALCDSDRNDITKLDNMIKEWSAVSEQPIETFLFSDPAALREQITAGKSFDIYLLGISNHGIELGKQLRVRAPDAPIIYVTRTKNYAYEAYTVGALRYLLKPVDAGELASALEFACFVHRALPGSKLTVRLPGAVTSISVDNVIYIENNVRSMKYVMKNGEVVNGTRRNISFEKFFEPLLASGRFVQTHKSFIANVSCIRTLRTSSAQMSNGVNVPISRRHINEVHRCYERFEMK